MTPINPISYPSITNVPSKNGRIEQGTDSFGSALKNAIDQVEQLHTDSQDQVKELLSGERSDLHNVMIAVEKADVAFQLMMQMRNKIVNAYQEISKMQF